MAKMKKKLGFQSKKLIFSAWPRLSEVPAYDFYLFSKPRTFLYVLPEIMFHMKHYLISVRTYIKLFHFYCLRIRNQNV